MEDASIEEKKIHFVSFCIECYKQAHAMHGGEVFELFENKGVNKFLYDNYDILHTQGEQWLLAEIEDFLNNDKQ